MPVANGTACLSSYGRKSVGQRRCEAAVQQFGRDQGDLARSQNVLDRSSRREGSEEAKDARAALCTTGRDGDGALEMAGLPIESIARRHGGAPPRRQCSLEEKA